MGPFSAHPASSTDKERISGTNRTQDSNVIVLLLPLDVRICNLLPGDGDFSGSHDFLDSDGFQEFDEGLDLFFIAGYLERVAFLRRINNARAKDVGYPERFCSVL